MNITPDEFNSYFQKHQTLQESYVLLLINCQIWAGMYTHQVAGRQTTPAMHTCTLAHVNIVRGDKMH